MERRRIAKNSALNLTGAVATGVFGLLQTALLAKCLALDDFGRVLIVENFYRVGIVVVGVKLSDLVLRTLPRIGADGPVGIGRAVVTVTLVVDAVVGALLVAVPFALAPWIAERLYGDASLATAFRIYAVAPLFFLFREDLALPILRTRDRFAAVVLPDVFAAAATLAALAWFLLGGGADFAGANEVTVVVGVLAGGMLLRALVPLLLTSGEIATLLRSATVGEARAALAAEGRDLFSTAWQSNLVGYLRLSADHGALFCLGLFAAPAEVAVYGIALRIAQVVEIAQTSVQTAITPEVLRTYSEERLSDVLGTVARLTGVATVVAALGAAVMLGFVEPLILLLSKPEYVAATPVLALLLPAAWIRFAATCSYPLALASNRLGRRNAVVALRLLLLAAATLYGLTAMVLAVVQLAGTVLVRVAFDLPMIVQMRRLARDR